MADIVLKNNNVSFLKQGDTVKGFYLDKYNLSKTPLMAFFDKQSDDIFVFRGWNNPKTGGGTGGGTGTGDMLKATYDADGNGRVDNADFVSTNTNFLKGTDNTQDALTTLDSKVANLNTKDILISDKTKEGNADTVAQKFQLTNKQIENIALNLGGTIVGRFKGATENYPVPTNEISRLFNIIENPEDGRITYSPTFPNNVKTFSIKAGTPILRNPRIVVKNTTSNDITFYIREIVNGLPTDSQSAVIPANSIAESIVFPGNFGFSEDSTREIVYFADVAGLEVVEDEYDLFYVSYDVIKEITKKLDIENFKIANALDVDTVTANGVLVSGADKNFSTSIPTIEQTDAQFELGLNSDYTIPKATFLEEVVPFPNTVGGNNLDYKKFSGVTIGSLTNVQGIEALKQTSTILTASLLFQPVNPDLNNPMKFKIREYVNSTLINEKEIIHTDTSTETFISSTERTLNVGDRYYITKTLMTNGQVDSASSMLKESNIIATNNNPLSKTLISQSYIEKEETYNASQTLKEEKLLSQKAIEEAIAANSGGGTGGTVYEFDTDVSTTIDLNSLENGYYKAYAVTKVPSAAPGFFMSVVGTARGFGIKRFGTPLSEPRVTVPVLNSSKPINLVAYMLNIIINDTYLGTTLNIMNPYSGDSEIHKKTMSTDSKIFTVPVGYIIYFIKIGG